MMSLLSIYFRGTTATAPQIQRPCHQHGCGACSLQRGRTVALTRATMGFLHGGRCQSRNAPSSFSLAA